MSRLTTLTLQPELLVDGINVACAYKFIGKISTKKCKQSNLQGFDDLVMCRPCYDYLL